MSSSANEKTCEMNRLIQSLRYAWASPTTMIGLCAVALTLLTRGRCSIVSGVLEAHGGIASWFLRKVVPLEHGASAMTLGHVVIGRDAECLTRTRTHERVHVRQCERWGPFFIPAYFIESALATLRGQDAYRGNRFEVQAFRLEAESLRIEAEADRSRNVEIVRDESE